MTEIDSTKNQERFEMPRLGGVSDTDLRNTLAGAIKKCHDDTMCSWFHVEEQSMADAIIKTYSNRLNRKILHSVTGTPRTVMGILSHCGLPQTTGYRKILTLIEERFLIPYDTIKRRGSKKTARYISTIEDLRVEIKGNIQVQLRIRISDSRSQIEKEESR